jgi:hypothetical protein
LPAARPVKSLSGGNPQIAKTDGDAPVQAYVAAMPGWKRRGDNLLNNRLGACHGFRIPAHIFCPITHHKIAIEY